MKGLALKNPLSGDRLFFAAALCVILIGIFFRFYHIDQRLFWQDEVFVVYRVSGYTEQDLDRELVDEKVHSFQDLEKYLHPAKNSKGLLALVKTAWEYPHIPPLYESLLWCWIQIFGDSIATIRTFSAILSLFAFPLIIWFCWELFRSYKPGWIAAVLMAVSPYQVLYAQEARNYSIWCVTILFSNAALLRAFRLGGGWAWALYAGSLALGLYAHTFFCFVFVAHVVYVLLLQRGSIKKMVLSCAAAALLFLPQTYLIVRYFQRILTAQDWLSGPVSIQVWFGQFWRGLAMLFFDPRMIFKFIERSDLPGLLKAAKIGLAFACLILVTAVFIYLWKIASRKKTALVLILFLINFLGLLIPDLMWGGSRMGESRYLMPAFLMIQVSIAYFIYLFTDSTSVSKKVFGYLLFASLLLMGSVSCSWRTKINIEPFSYPERVYRGITGFLNANRGSLIIRPDRSLHFRKLFITYFYLKDKNNTFFTCLSKEKPFRADFGPYPKKLLTFSIRSSPMNELEYWVGHSGGYKLAPVGPKHWQGGRERIYEIEMLRHAK